MKGWDQPSLIRQKVGTFGLDIIRGMEVVVFSNFQSLLRVADLVFIYLGGLQTAVQLCDKKDEILDLYIGEKKQSHQKGDN